MPYNPHDIKIERTPYVAYKNAHRINSRGIYIDNLPKYQRRLLVENPIIENIEICSNTTIQTCYKTALFEQFWGYITPTATTCERNVIEV